MKWTAGGLLLLAIAPATWADLAGQTTVGVRAGFTSASLTGDDIDGPSRHSGFTAGGFVSLGNGSAMSFEVGGAYTQKGVRALDGTTRARLDLDYVEDYRAEVDFNVVMTDRGDFVEVQGTAEEGAFPRRTLDEVLSLAESGIHSLFDVQQEAIRQFKPRLPGSQ